MKAPIKITDLNSGILGLLLALGFPKLADISISRKLGIYDKIRSRHAACFRLHVCSLANFVCLPGEHASSCAATPAVDIVHYEVLVAQYYAHFFCWARSIATDLRIPPPPEGQPPPGLTQTWSAFSVPHFKLPIATDPKTKTKTALQQIPKPPVANAPQDLQPPPPLQDCATSSWQHPQDLQPPPPVQDCDRSSWQDLPPQSSCREPKRFQPEEQPAAAAPQHIPNPSSRLASPEMQPPTKHATTAPRQTRVSRLSPPPGLLQSPPEVATTAPQHLQTTSSRPAPKVATSPKPLSSSAPENLRPPPPPPPRASPVPSAPSPGQSAKVHHQKLPPKAAENNPNAGPPPRTDLQTAQGGTAAASKSGEGKGRPPLPVPIAAMDSGKAKASPEEVWNKRVASEAVYT